MPCYDDLVGRTAIFSSKFDPGNLANLDPSIVNETSDIGIGNRIVPRYTSVVHKLEKKVGNLAPENIVGGF